MSVEYVSPHEVAALLRGESEESFVIVDVRDTDFNGGHIRGAFNIPIFNFSDLELVKQLVSGWKEKDRVIFHCMLSQSRGPKAARTFWRACAEQRPRIPLRVQILRGGFEGFVLAFGRDKENSDLFEDLELSWYEDEDSSEDGV
eukprot:TRINITY_DN1447_c0_g1_i1.p3 TRINITY_DN1447_c0_g1~~TRINITY_DN1447_c0_g1_i1.p3  ORF type:complete len:144 (+),score=40.64 TRINITY_DN1447_c0_g1_i1:100-531(+)